MLVAGKLPLSDQYRKRLPVYIASAIASNHAHANLTTAVRNGILQPYTVVWLAINRDRFIDQECSHG